MRIVTEKGKGKRIISLLLAIVCFISLLLAKGSIKALLILVTGILTLGFLRVEFKNEKLQKGLFCVVFLIAPIVTFFIGQFMQEVAFGHVSFTCVLLNAGIILLFQLIVLLLSKDLRKSIALGCVVPSLATLVNAYVFMFRGNALTPSDLLSLRTAANVAAEYVFTPTMPMLYAMILVALLVLGVYCLPQQAVARTKWNMIGQISIIAVCAIALIYGGAKQKPYHWHNEGAMINGFLLNFSLQIRETFTPKPKGYNTETIEALEEEYTKETNPAVSYPDIIVIMDESFADLDVFEKRLSTNMEVTPFMDTLQEDTIRGYLYASVFGGSTANSEYEFLSGNTMAFFPQGSIVYQQFFSENAYTIVSILKENGYECVAMHPYHANGWLRESVYPKMGFDETYFLEDFPQKKLIREYVSDQEMFDYIIDYHEQHDEGAPLFLFGVTMQNHGGYSYIGENYEPIIYLEGYSRDYPDVEQYLTLAYETDKAVKNLIAYYQSANRDVVIAFFGDHMPNLSAAFYEELNNGAFDTLDEQMRKQKVPFFIWANFDIAEKEVPCSSINYLSTYVLEAAGIPLPPYHQFLSQTESAIPAINAYGYYSQELQGFVSVEEATNTETAAIEAYNILQYNNAIDKANRSDYFFEP